MGNARPAIAGALIFFGAILLVVRFFPNPTPFQELGLRYGFTGQAAFLGAMLPEAFGITVKTPIVRATGAVALGALVYLVNPPGLSRGSSNSQTEALLAPSASSEARVSGDRKNKL